MQKIKLVINKLGAIENSEIEISPIMIFSGDSGLGKSYLAILCHYFFEVLLNHKRLDSFIKENGWDFSEMRPSFRDSGRAFIFKKNALEAWLAEDAVRYLRHMLNNIAMSPSIEVHLPSSIDEEISVLYEEEAVKLQENVETYIKLMTLDLVYSVKDGDSLYSESPFAFILRYGLMDKILGNFKALSDSFVFPPSRGPVLTEEIIPITGLYEKYKIGLTKIDKYQPHADSVDQRLIGLLRRVLEGSVARKEGKYVYTVNEEELPISAAAASIREIAPLALLIERMDTSKLVMLIEEPEAHLHPLKQRMMADIISILCKGGAYMQITTHSDYFLRRLNELIGLKRIHDEYPERYENICEELEMDSDMEFPVDRLSAYLLKRRDDGSSYIEKQDVEDGVPFASFSEAIDRSLKNRVRIFDYLNGGDGNN